MQNENKVDDDGITPMEKFSVTTTDITIKTTTHGSIQFISRMIYCKEIYLDYPSGKTAHVQVSILVNKHFMQGQ